MSFENDITHIKKLIEDSPLFKAASDEELRARGTKHPRLARIPGPEGFPYKFLKYIENPDPELSHWDVVGLPDFYDMDNSTVWFSSSEPEFVMYIDTDVIIDNYLTRNDSLTTDFSEFKGHQQQMYSGNSTPAEWIKQRGFQVLEHGNTYNTDPAYFWGDKFEWFQIKDRDGKEWIVLEMEKGNKSGVYSGDLDDFYMAQDIGDPKEEVANLFGYTHYENLVYDIKKYRGAATEEDKPGTEEPIRGQMRWRLAGDNPAETYTESKKD